MNIRNETINKVCRLLGEDVEDQFTISEMRAAIEGISHFCVTNKNSEGVFIRSIYNETADVSDYVIAGYDVCKK